MSTNTQELIRQRILALIAFLFIVVLFICLYWFFIGQFEETETINLKNSLVNLNLPN